MRLYGDHYSAAVDTKHESKYHLKNNYEVPTKFPLTFSYGQYNK